MRDELISKTKKIFQSKFQITPKKMILSPGRINIIGEHIDYNDGFVLPGAIDKYICFGFNKNNSNTSQIYAIDFDSFFEFDIVTKIKKSDLQWTNYLLGVCNQLKINNFEIKGFDCVFCSDIPIGAGLSSSAALVCGFLYGLNELFELRLSPIQIALMGQKAEQWVGINCGIMDQFASVMGLENKLLKIDCRTLDFEYFDADFREYSIVLFDSKITHALANSAYNLRRKQCEEGLKIIQNYFPEVHSFRDFSLLKLDSLASEMNKIVFKRCQYVIKEIGRVEAACIAIQAKNITDLGTLMYKTHQGLADEYEVSCPELDFLVRTVQSKNWSIGSRVMGGGFGGCTINLIEKNIENQVVKDMKELYFEKFGLELINYTVNLSNGTCLIDAAL